MSEAGTTFSGEKIQDVDSQIPPEMDDGQTMGYEHDLVRSLDINIPEPGPSTPNPPKKAKTQPEASTPPLKFKLTRFCAEWCGLKAEVRRTQDHDKDDRNIKSRVHQLPKKIQACLPGNAGCA